MEQQQYNARALHVVVVVAGIIGASIAYALARRQVAVTLVERQQPGRGASSHSFAWLNAFAKEPQAYHDLNRRSMEMWRRFTHDLGVDVGLHWGGELRWVATTADAAALQQHVQHLQAWGYPNRMITPQELSRLEPGLRPGPISAAAFGPIDGQVEPERVIAACLHHARAQHATVHTQTPVTGLHCSTAGVSTRRITAVQTSQGDIPCDMVVLASGVDTTALAAMAQVPIPQQESPGVVVRLTACPRLLQQVSIVHMPPLSPARPEIHLRQLSDGTLQIGEGTQESLQRDDSQAHADDLLARATSALPGLTGSRALPVPVGYRPMPADGFPVLGFTAAVPNLYIALMHSGVTLAPLISELASLEIIDGARVDMLAPYRPERFVQG